MIALDNSESSVNALKWAIDNYIHVGNNDLVVLANVREPIISPVYGPGSSNNL